MTEVEWRGLVKICEVALLSNSSLVIERVRQIAGLYQPQDIRRSQLLCMVKVATMRKSARSIAERRWAPVDGSHP